MSSTVLTREPLERFREGFLRPAASFLVVENRDYPVQLPQFDVVAINEGLGDIDCALIGRDGLKGFEVPVAVD
jgi:hypothetical protein